MLAARALLAGLSVARLLAGADASAGRFAPIYASSTVVHAASQESGTFAPNTIVTLYGRNLGYVTKGIAGADVRDGLLPTVLSGTGVRVYLDNLAAPLYFVSPTQVNLLLPGNLTRGVHKLHVALDGQAGPQVEVRVAAAAPGLFLQLPWLAVAVRLDGSLVNTERPAQPGDTVILFATGLGTVAGPVLRWGQVAGSAAWLAALDQFGVRLNGRTVPRDHIFYVGLAPGFAGLYQINMRIPADAPANPEVQLFAEGFASAAGVRIAVGESAGP